MDRDAQASVTRLLGEMQGGSRQAADALVALLYEELHGLAHRQRRGWHGDLTLNTTALVHEAYVRLVEDTSPAWEGRSHFLGVAARAMRHVLIDYARRRKTEKRGGDVPKVSFEEVREALADDLAHADARAEILIVLEEALERLERENERAARIVECRFFGGMTIEETAQALGVGPATVVRGWETARTWLYREMTRIEA